MVNIALLKVDIKPDSHGTEYVLATWQMGIPGFLSWGQLIVARKALATAIVVRVKARLISEGFPITLMFLILGFFPWWWK